MGGRMERGGACSKSVQIGDTALDARGGGKGRQGAREREALTPYTDAPGSKWRRSRREGPLASIHNNMQSILQPGHYTTTNTPPQPFRGSPKASLPLEQPLGWGFCVVLCTFALARTLRVSGMLVVADKVQVFWLWLVATV